MHVVTYAAWRSSTAWMETQRRWGFNCFKQQRNGGFLSHRAIGVPPVIMHVDIYIYMLLGFSLTKTIQCGVPPLWKPPNGHVFTQQMNLVAACHPSHATDRFPIPSPRFSRCVFSQTELMTITVEEQEEDLFKCARSPMANSCKMTRGDAPGWMCSF